MWVDFITLANSGERVFPKSGEQDPGAWGGHNRIDCILTLDMAKELAAAGRFGATSSPASAGHGRSAQPKSRHTITNCGQK